MLNPNVSKALAKAANDYNLPQHVVRRVVGVIASHPPDQHVERAAQFVRELHSHKLREFSRWTWEHGAKGPTAPVDPAKFLLHGRYLGLAGEVYPKVLEEFVKMNSGNYMEVVLTGAIGTAKTTLAIWTEAYQLYLLSKMRNPHAEFRLDRSSEILFIFQSLNAKLAEALNFERFKALIHRSPYFSEEFPYDKGLESELQFPRRIIVKPISGKDTAAIGQNVFGGILDEVNFMAVTQNSKKSSDGGTYDQALSLYNSIARRRKSRFMRDGKVPGIFCIVSSKRYPGQFTDQKEEEAKTDPTIYIYDKRTWDVLPSDRFSGKWFKVFKGDLTRKPHIMEEGEEVSPRDQHLVIDVPEEYRRDFENDMMNALRDIAGVSTLARFPYMVNTDAVAACFGKVKSVLSREECDFTTTKLAILPQRFRDLEHPRFVHIDLGITGDAAGVACGYVPEFTKVDVGNGMHELLPVIRMDFTLRITPPKNDEIKFHKIRELLYKLRDLGIPIRWVSLDSFQSRDTLQILRQKGFMTGLVSVDTTSVPYDTTKTAMYQGRVQTIAHEHCEREFVSLERDPKKDKIDHPPSGSKDIADAVAGVVYGLTMRRDIWAQHGVSLNEIPESIRSVVVKTERKMKEDVAESD